ncbi:MAG: SGNH/GDSL hydrolase family protein [Rhodospirillales bacterium]|nr:SGNH/GDSL hydrolase family protein [Rhodospirillales bacterium]
MHKSSIIGSAILLLFSMAIGLGISESIYRFVLYSQHIDRFKKPVSEHVGVYDRSHWSYSEEFGYGYPPDRKIHYSGISRDGIVVACGLIDVINERGNIGPIEGSYKDADLKVLVFGDSWAAFNINRTTWPDLLQRDLQARLGRSVHVVNFGRDGYGILQMFELAAYEIERWKPDLIIFAFITNDLARLRPWRVPIVEEGREVRVITHFEKSKTPDMDKAYDTFLIHPDATPEWCEKAKARGTTDEVAAAIFAKREGSIEATGDKWADIYTLSTSFLLNRVLHGNPFHGVKDRYSFPSMEIDDYARDGGFKAALEKVKSSGVPALMFHHAFYPEVIAGKEYIMNYKETSLLKSLIRETEFPMIETLKNVDLPVKNPERMNASETNFHPSLWGMDFYSKALTRALVDKGILSDRVPGMAARQ